MLIQIRIFGPFLAISWPIVHNLVTDKLRNASVVGRVPKIVGRKVLFYQ